MTLRLHDTATRSVRDFVPKTPGQVGIYLCGLTVQSVPHIGHLRSGVNYDVLRRWLLHTGYDVTFIRNITDVDDKILVKSLEQGRPFWAIAYANKLVLDADYRALNVLPPTYEPLATAHIPEMHELIRELIERGPRLPVGGRQRRRVLRRAVLPGVRRAVRAEPGRHAAAGRRRRAGQARLPRLRAVEGRQGRRAGRRLLALAVGPRPARAGTSSARRWPGATSATSSTSTAAGST